MNSKFKIITLTTTVALLFTLAGQSFAATQPFSDLSHVDAPEKIISLYEKGIVQGVTSHQFFPLAPLTAAQGIQLIVNTFDLNLDFVKFAKDPKATDYYALANNDAWYADTLIIATVNKIDLPTDLDPNEQWTRQEFTYHLVQAMERHGNLPMINLLPVKVSDESALTIEYSGSIQRALSYGLVKLDAEQNFHPQAVISRADATEQIYNALEYLQAHPAPVINE
ncbi:S-layer homology domain-containing protein [Paenibacillus crassostreae]|uniref:S-layer protein n=1 Tax=Paenibacillus crassostreae TaxID=1763538 RepID=A0A167B9W5_9BACL|nr:S-layer homology domain-containing protein [Paenibacillus crassostreae]AOZ93041.1 S-layer protein [Paenibacillus crassostreae]OAB71871.1 S-layer protein [Paenibacillus crassostreae]